MKIWGLTILLFFYSCSVDGQSICTEEFVTITVKIHGDTLTDYYTVVGVNEADTIRLSKIGELYAILDDSYQKVLVGREDWFVFHGFSGDSLIVKENYIISADECHISKLQGKGEIILTSD